MLIGRGGEVRLAPLYDIVSFLPYGVRKLTLAMKIGGTYRLHDIGVYAWAKLGRSRSRAGARADRADVRGAP